MPVSPPPSPTHLLRIHSDQISALFFSDDNERLYSGDASGLVVVTSTKNLRSLVSWKAHTSGILGLKECEWRFIITHGRDNKLHVWKQISEPSTSNVGTGSATSPPSLPAPELLYSLDVNAMNFCAFSLLASPGTGTDLLAVPNLVESSLADVWALPSKDRLHAAIGKTRITSPGTVETGIIMSLHLHWAQHPSTSERTVLQLLAAYENGGVELWRFCRTDGKQTSVEGAGWECIWSVKQHAESIMAMTVSRDSTLALTVSADHLIGRYDLLKAAEGEPEACTIHRTKHPGNAAIAIHDRGRVCAVGAWDGRIRLYSTKTLKSLGTLDYHKTGCQAVAFARSDPVVDVTQVGEDDDDVDEAEQDARKRWLAGGGKDGRVSIWALMDFEKK